MYKEEDLEVKNIIKNVFHFIYFSPNSELFTVCCEMCILLQIETRATFCANVRIFRWHLAHCRLIRADSQKIPF